MAGDSKCFLCKQEKEDPLMLWPCTHVFCRACLGAWEPKHSLRLPNDSTCIECPQCHQLALMQGSLDRFPRSMSLCNATGTREAPQDSPMLCRDEVRSRLREARCRLEQRQEAVFDSMAIIRRRIPEVRQEGKEKKEEVRLFISAIQEELIKRQHYLYEQIDEAVEEAVSYCHQRTDQLAENTSLLANYTEGLSDLMNRTYKDGGASYELELMDFLSGVEQVCATAVTTAEERIPLDTPKNFRLPAINVSVLVDSAVFDCGPNGMSPGQGLRSASQTHLATPFKARPPRHLRPLQREARQKNVSVSISQPSTPSPTSWREIQRKRNLAKKKGGSTAAMRRKELTKRPVSAPLTSDALSLLSDTSQMDCHLARSSSMQVLCSASDHYSSSSTYNSPGSDSRDETPLRSETVKPKLITVKSARDIVLPPPDCNLVAGPNVTRMNTNPSRLPIHPCRFVERRIHSQQDAMDMKGHGRPCRQSCVMQDMQQSLPMVNLPGSIRPMPCQAYGHSSNPTPVSGYETEKRTRPRSEGVHPAGDYSSMQHHHHTDRRSRAQFGSNSNDEFEDRNWSSKASSDTRPSSPADVYADETTSSVTESPPKFTAAAGSANQSNSSEPEVSTKSPPTYSVEEDIHELSSACKDHDLQWSSTDIPHSTFIVLTSKVPDDSVTHKPALSEVPEMTDLRAIYQPQLRTQLGSRPVDTTYEKSLALEASSSSEIIYPLDGERKVGSIRRKQLSVDDVFLLSASSHESLSRLRGCKSTPVNAGECLTRSTPKHDMVIDWRMTVSDRGPLITLSWQRIKGAEQYKISTHDLDLVECDSKGAWHIVLGGSYLHEVFTTEVSTLLVHAKYDHCYAISVMALGPGGAPLATSYPETVRTPRRVRFEHVQFDPQTCHANVAVDPSRRGLIHRSSPFSFFQEQCIVNSLKTLLGSLACRSFPTSTPGLDLVYWECRVCFKVVVFESLEETLCTVGICQASSVDKEDALSKNRRSLCCVFSQDGLGVVLQFWDGWRPAVGLSETKVRVLELEQRREASIGLGFLLAFSRRALVVVDPDKDVVLHEFRLPKREVTWYLASSLHRQKEVPTTLTWLRPLSLPTCLMPVAC